MDPINNPAINTAGVPSNVKRAQDETGFVFLFGKAIQLIIPPHLITGVGY